MSAEQTYIYSGNSLGASPVIVNAQSLLYPILTIKNGALYPTLQSINMVTGDVNWTFSAGVNFQCTPAVNDGTIYIGNNDGNLYAVDLATGTQQWSLAVSQKLQGTQVFDPVSGLVFTADADGGFYAVDPVSKTVKWSFQFPGSLEDYTMVSPAVIVDGILFTSRGVNNSSVPEVGNVYAFNAVTGALQWNQNMNSAVSSPLAAGDGLIFVSCFDGTMRALNQTTGVELWSFQMGKYTLGQPAYDSGWVYFASQDGNFYAHASHPVPLKISEWAIPVTNELTSGVLVNGGNAYFGGWDASGNGSFYVLDLVDAQHGNPQALTDGLEGQLIFTPDIAFNKIAFCAQGFFGGELIMIDLGILSATPAETLDLPLKPTPRPAKADPLSTADTGGMLQMAQFTSKLIVDQYDVSGTTAAPTTPAFQMMLSLYDENQAPQTSSNVSVWASEAVTMTAGDQSYSIGTDPSKPAVLAASAAGQLAVSSPGSLGIANIFLQPDFFLPGFYLTVFPDIGNFQTMSNLQATDLDPTTALGYDGQPILLSNFQDVASRTAIASSISNAVGRQPQETASRMVASLADDAPSRSYHPGAVPSFEINFSSGITFSPSNSEQIAKLFGGPNGPGEFWTADDFLGWDDFIKNIVNGIEKIGSIIWHFAEGVAGVIVNGLENAYNFIVQTVDQAIQVAAGIFKQVVADISKVIEWLSYLFSWSDIVNTHLLIKNQILATIDNFQAWVTGELQGTTNDLNSFFTSREADALTLFDGIIAGLGGQTVDGVRQIGGDPNAAFSAQGQDVSTQANWLPRKLSENASGGSLSSLAAVGDSTPMAAIEAFFQNVGKQITSDPALQSLPNDAKVALSNFSQLFTSSAGFNGQSLADVLAVVRDLVAGLIHLGQVVSDAFLTLLQAIIDGIVSFLTGTIQIPFLSDFYQSIAGDQLSVLSLFSLIAAVPTTIVYKLITGTSPGSGSLDAAPSGATEYLGLANTFTLLLLLPLWIGADLAEFPAIMSGAIAGASAIQCGLALTLICLGDPTSMDYVFWTLQFFSVILAAFGVWVGSAWAATAPMIYGIYGFGMMIMYILAAALDPTNYFDPDSETFFNNIASALPFLGQPMAYIQVDDVGPAAVALVDTVGFGTAAALSTILFWTGH